MEEELVGEKLARIGVPNPLDDGVVLLNDEIYFKENKRIDFEDLQYRLSCPTFSLSAKFYPRINPSKTYARLDPGTFTEGPPFKKATKSEVQKITDRLTRGTTATKEREQVTAKEREVYAKTDHQSSKNKDGTANKQTKTQKYPEVWSQTSRNSRKDTNRSRQSKSVHFY